MKSILSAAFVATGILAVTATPTPTLKDVPSRTIVKRDGPGTTLQSGFYWIRAVESPYYYYYLQTDPQYTTGPAIMGSYKSAGQFNVQDGQLVELIDTEGTLLYMNVEQPTDNSTKKLATSFGTKPGSFGGFAWQGDALMWSVSSIERPNNAAWLICEDDALYVNLGSYGYQTPEGCSDATIHYYNAATASE